MTKKRFTPEEVAILAANPFTYCVTVETIRFTKEFKEQYRYRYLQGHNCTHIFKDLVYDISILGAKRIYSYDSRVKAESVLDNEDVLKEQAEEQYVDKDAVITRLQNEVMYLRQESVSGAGCTFFFI